MGFSDKQIRALSRRVPERNIRSRISDGKELSYIEGWYALAEANRIFGFDGWDRETAETKCVIAREVRGTWAVVYFARVRVTVRADGHTIVRDGHGTGEAHGSGVGEAHDRALKAAETDATKRALATFGKAFGLALYGTQNQMAAKGDHSRVRPSAAEINPAASVQRSQSVTPNAVASVPRPADHRQGPGRTGLESAYAGVAAALLPIARIDKSALTFGEPRRVRDKDHLRFVAMQACLLCSAAPSDAHHLRFAQPRAMGRKVGDEFTVPLCRAHHSELHHSGNEVSWWHDMGIDPLEIAKQLWNESGHRLNGGAAQNYRR